MNVFCYWEGPRPPYIDVCLQTIRQACYRDCCFHLVTPENFDKYVTDHLVHPSWKNIRQLGVKSDVVRAACLAQFGGLYVDADTVMLRSPVGIIDESSQVAYMRWSRPPDRVIAGYVYANKDVGKKWLNRINAKLAENKTGWCELGEQCLTPIVNEIDPRERQELPLETFLPIEIDRRVRRFFSSGNPEGYVTPDTIAFGLNHSWFSSRRPDVMAAINHGHDHNSLIGKLMRLATDLLRSPKIGVACATYRRPHLLSQLLWCFENQTCDNVELLAIDDSGDVAPAAGPGWTVETHERYPTLGVKRNAIASMLRNRGADVIVPWDDDDLAMPWALDAIRRATHWSDFVRPSRALVPGRAGLHPVQTYYRQDKSDKAFHPAWGYTTGAFFSVGGYPDELSHGEDLGLAKRFRDAGISESDPVELGASPYYVFAPHDNEHFGYYHKDYTTWPDKIQSPNGCTVAAVEPEFKMSPILANHVIPRPFRGDWWESDQQ